MRVRTLSIFLLLACHHTIRAAAVTDQKKGTPVPLPGGSPAGIGFDDLRFSPKLHRVIAPAGRTGSLDLVDPSTKAITAIGGFSSDASFGGGSGHGEGTTSADEGRGMIFASDRTQRALVVVDPQAGKVVTSVKLAAGPDYVRWVEPTGEIWVTEPNAEQIEIFSFDGKTPKQAATISVKGGPESFVVDATRRRAYTHSWKGSTFAIDLDRRQIVATWPNGCEGSRGVALDEGRGWLFAGCDEGTASILDVAHDGKILSKLASGAKGVDVIAYNPTLGHLYYPGEDSATMAVLGVTSDAKLSVLGVFPAASGSHCATADDAGGAWVCDPSGGQLLYFADPFPATLK
jgi:hypothetical protein